MARKKKRRSWRDSSSKGTALVDLINGRAMMMVSLLYDELEFPKREGRGTLYVQRYLRDYKEHQARVRECLTQCYEVLVEAKTERKDPLDLELVKQLKQVITAEIGYIWEGKKRPVVKKPEVTDFFDEYEDDEENEEAKVETKVEVQPETPEEIPQREEELDWESRFSDGEFDLE
jgi:hypothetical protein